MKTAEELIAAYKQMDDYTPHRGELFEWIDSAVEYLESQRWHPVSSYDEIPKGRWLVTFDDGTVMTHDKREQLNVPGIAPDRIIAYRALPEGYEGCTCLPLPEPHDDNCPVHGEQL